MIQSPLRPGKPAPNLWVWGWFFALNPGRAWILITYVQKGLLSKFELESHAIKQSRITEIRTWRNSFLWMCSEYTWEISYTKRVEIIQNANNIFSETMAAYDDCCLLVWIRDIEGSYTGYLPSQKEKYQDFRNFMHKVQLSGIYLISELMVP